MRQKRKNKKKKIIIIMAVLLLILILLCLILKKVEEKNSAVTYLGTKEAELASEYLKEKVIPQGTYQFTMNYKGNISKDKFYEALNDTVNYLEDLSQDIEDINFEAIFEEQEIEIKEYLGIEKQEDFIKVCELLKGKDIQNTKLSYCKIIENTFYTEDIYTKFNMIFYYENGTEIEVQVGILNKEASKSYVLTIFG